MSNAPGRTLLYNAYFASIWCTNIVAIPAVGFLLIWSVAWFQVPARLVVGLAVAIVGLTWIVYLRTHGSRVLMRSGVWPSFCVGDAFPVTEEQLTTAVARMYAEHGKPPTVVGSGWGFFLYRKGPPRPRVFLHNFKGVQPGTNRWRSGSTILQVQQTLIKRKPSVCFRTHATMDYISIGSWFACANHGNGGATAGKSSDALKNARVLDMTTNSIETLDYPEIRRRFDGGDASNYCIIDCEFHNFAPNDEIQKRCIVVDSPRAAAEWLSPTADLRLLFLGKTRDVGLGVQWLPVYDADNPRVDPHFCSRWCNFFQVDVFSVVLGWYESSYVERDGIKYLETYSGRTKRYHANKWMPIVWPWQTVTIIFSGYRNFEVFFKLDRSLDGQTLWRMVQTLIAMHKKHGGRSEIRYGAPGGVICLDVSMNRDFEAVFQRVRDFGTDTVALHPGKWNDPLELDTHPCRRIPIGRL